ncbi:hypothetical protein HYW73_02855 [Candidatus Nomurabacteria bacterium]|nr:hypothetical protein [Candidatus Nomurabacteria bacterium]
MKKALRKPKHFYKNRHLVKNAALLGASLLILGAGASTVFLFSMKLPDFRSFEDRKVVNSTQIYDRTGEVLLYDIHEDIKRTYITFDQMSLNFTIIAESESLPLFAPYWRIYLPTKLKEAQL